jgi:predicted TIM-barrel fold metal-dependent hydrolase
MSLSFSHVVSGDSHVMEPADLWEKALGTKHGDLTPRVFTNYKGRTGRFFWTGKQVRKFAAIEKEQDQLGFREAGYIPEKRVDFQKKAGVESEVLYTTHMLLQYPSDYPEVLRDSAAVFNDWLAEFCSYAPRRLVGIAVIPMHDVGWATREIERAAKNGLKGAMINLAAPKGSAPYRKAAYDPFWARAAELGVPITLHAATGQCPDPLHFETPAELEQVSGAMLSLFAEIMPVLSDDFIFGGILDRHPRLKLVIGEFDLGWLPYFMFRIDSMRNGLGPYVDMPKLKMKPSDYVRERMWHGVINDPDSAYVVPKIGADRILWGSDFPHIRSIGLDAQGHVKNLLAGLARADQEKVVGGNTVDLYGLA